MSIFGIKKPLINGIAGALTGLFLLGSSSAFAASTVPGSVCNPAHNPVTGTGAGSIIRYFWGSAFGAGSSNLVDCPIPNNTSNGTVVFFRINVTDNSPSDIECQGLGMDLNGNVVLSTSAATSSGTGNQTILATASIPSGVNGSALAYSVNCTLPGPNGQFISSINSIKID